MRYHEIASGLRVLCFAEEQAVLEKIGNGAKLSSLDDREHEIARLLVNRGLLDRIRDKDGDIVYKVSSPKNIWRF